MNTMPKIDSKGTGCSSSNGTQLRKATVETTWKSLSKAQQKYAKQLHEDEGWSMREAVLLAFETVQP
jgi:hypothetical protein